MHRQVSGEGQQASLAISDLLGKNESGKKKFEIRAGFRKEAEARVAMSARLRELESSSPAPRTTAITAEPTFAEWLRTWLDTYAPRRCQPKTLERYEQLADYILNRGSSGADGAHLDKVKHPAEELAKTRLRDVTHSAIERTLWELMKVKAKRRAHLSAKTVRHIEGLLSVALNKAFRLDMITVNPMLKVELPSVERHDDARSLTSDEIGRLRDVCQGDWTFAFVEVDLATGARRGELLALTWSDIDWIGRRVTVGKSLEQTKKGLRVKATKSGKPRGFTLPQSAITALSFVRDQQADHRRIFGADYNNDDLVFCRADGSYLDPALVSQTISRRLRKAGINDASLHTMRHNHASIMLSGGVPLPAVSLRLGHADTRTRT